VDDRAIFERIQALVDEEHTLERGRTGVGLSAEEARRLDDVEVQLDQCWDLLRQRRARRRAGLDPDEAEARDAATVEHYQQ
jgi:hypothetical protein